MVEIKKLKDDIVKVLFYINIILLVTSIFTSSKIFFMSTIIINIIFNGTFIVIDKWGYIFEIKEGIFGKSFGKLGDSLDYFTNLGKKDGKI